MIEIKTPVVHVGHIIEALRNASEDEIRQLFERNCDECNGTGKFFYVNRQKPVWDTCFKCDGDAEFKQPTILGAYVKSIATGAVWDWANR